MTSSTLPAHLQGALKGVVAFMQRGSSGEAAGGDVDVVDDYSNLLKAHRSAALAFLAERMERKTNGSFSVREADVSLLRSRVRLARGPILCLVLCRPTRRRGAVVIQLGDEDELYFIPRRDTEPSTGLRVRKV